MVIKSPRSVALALAASAIAVTTSFAGTEEPAKEKVVVIEEEEAAAFSGWVSFDLNSHFISYGADVWAGGTNWNRGTFNPSAELAWATPIPGLSVLLGTWWDVNNNVPSAIGGQLQEVDVWTGLSYSIYDFSVTVLYQAWIYGGDTEQILDIFLKYNNNTFLNPGIVIHNRLNPGAAEGGGGTDGTFFVPNISYNIPIGPLTITPAASMGFATDEFHGGGGGYAYTALGVTGSVPVPYLPGDWEIHGGITYYNTNDYVIPSNPSENFVTGNVGVKLSF